jgi:hypothetical protein
MQEVENRNRVTLDDHLQELVEFMQANVPAKNWYMLPHVRGA